jgi:hypothetical protein
MKKNSAIILGKRYSSIPTEIFRCGCSRDERILKADFQIVGSAG